MDREIQRDDSPSRPSSGQDNNPNRPSPAEQVARANAQANAERAKDNRAALIAAEQAHDNRVRQQVAREQAAAADRQREQQMRAREAAAAEARNAARAEEERKEAARIAQAQEDARIARAREEAREAQRQRTIGIAQSVPDPMQGGLGGLTNLLGKIPGVPMLIDAAKGAAGDIQMSYYAGGPLRSREEQRRNLQEARNPDGSRMYSDVEIDEYFLVTDETAERARQQAGVRPGGDDSMPYTLPAAADPCPEGYRMDSVTNMCVPADDVTGGTPPPVVPGFPDLTRPDPVAVPTVVGSSDYTQMPVTGGVPPLLPGTGALPMPDFSRGFMPTTYGGMPTDIDPFR